MQIPVALTIAGSDNSAGAGLQADLKAMSALGVYGLTAVTCVVAEVPGRVSAIQPIEPHIVAEQIRLCFRAYPVAAVKTGMLWSCDIIAAVADVLEECFAKTGRVPLVVDPVMVATSGDALVEKDAVALYRARLFPMARVVTPNLDEVRTLLGQPIRSIAAMQRAGRVLARESGAAFLIKGGHLRGRTATDLLFDGTAEHRFDAPFIPRVSTHGTGCTLSAAIAAGLARGVDLPQAVAFAKGHVSHAIRHFLRWRCDGKTTDALHHFAPPARD